MRLNERIRGLEKVKFWLVVLMFFLSASLGMWIGQMLPTRVAVPDSALKQVKDIVMALWQFFRDAYAADVTTFWAAMLIALILVCVGAYLYLRFRPKTRKTSSINSISDLVMLQILLYVGTMALFAAMTAYVYMDELVMLFLSGTLGLLTWVTVGQIVKVLRDVYVKRNSEDYVYFERNKKRVLAVTTLIGMAMVGLPLWLPGFWGTRLRVVGDAGELWGYYTALLSLTFISISVMSVLSDRSVVIYWDNIAEGKLIKPVFGSFAAYTYYSIGAAIGAGISVAARNTVGFITFCLINIFTIIVLTLSMVDVYYDREGKKERKVKELHDDLRDYTLVCQEQSLPGDHTQAELRNMRIGHRNYEEKMLLLYQHISRACDEHDLMYLQEVYDLVVKNPRCFQSPYGKRVVQLLYSRCTEETWPLMTLSIRDLLDHMEKHQVRDEDPLTDGFVHERYGWDQDVLLWQSLTEAPYLRQWLQRVGEDSFGKQELQDFMRSVIRRWVILYNDMATHGNKPGSQKPQEPAQKETDLLGIGGSLRGMKAAWQDFTAIFKREPEMTPEKLPYDYLKLIQRGDSILVCTEREEKPAPEQIRALMDTAWVEMAEKSPLTAALTGIMRLIPEHLGQDGRETWQAYLKEFPLPQEIIH